MVRQSGQLEISYYKGFGGKSYDSHHYAEAFRSERPHHFGMMVSKLFSAMHRYDNKVLTNLTYLRGNYEEIYTDTYKWTLAGDSEVDFRVTELLVSASGTPGKGLATFQIALDKGWLSEPDVLQVEDNRFPFLEILGTPQQVGDSWYYTVRLQSSDPNDWIDPAQLAVGMTMIKASTTIVTEMNDKRGTDAYNSQMDLQCQVGAYGEEFAITDKVVRQEIAAVARGEDLNNIDKKYRTSEGYAFTIRQGDKVIPRGAFITMAEARLLERIDMDCEMAMVFGTNSNLQDIDTGRVKKTAPGFRQLVKDGHVYYHNGSLTAQLLEDYLHGIFLHRLNTGDRKIKIATGEGGIRMFHQIIADEANSFLTVDSNFIKGTSSPFSSNALQFGGQFTKFIANNGIEVELVYDPLKDDRKYCKRRHPDNPIYTVDSFRMDIYDFGMSDGEANMSMVIEKNIDAYAYVSNLVDPKTGVINTGAKVASFDKGIRMMREKSGSLWIKDTSRVGSIIYEPEL